MAYMTSSACSHGAYVLKKQDDYESSLAVNGTPGQPAEESAETAGTSAKPPRANARPPRRSTQPVRTSAQPAASGAGAPKVSRQEIAAIVDRFLANRQPESDPSPLAPATPQPDYSTSSGGNGASSREPAKAPSQSSANGRKAAEFVSEDDVKRAIQKGEKIYVGPRTIITPSARDIGDPAEVFAKA